MNDKSKMNRGRLDRVIEEFRGMEAPGRPSDEKVIGRIMAERSRRMWTRRVFTAAAASAVLIGGIGVYLIGRDEKTASMAQNSTPASNPQTRSTMENLQVNRARANRSVGLQVDESPVIVVGKAKGFDVAPPKVQGDAPEYFVHYEVIRFLKGGIDKQIIDVRTPTAPGEFIDKEWILLLSNEYLEGKYLYAGVVNIKSEQEIKDLIEHKGK
jgi:hypothetical protein